MNINVWTNFSKRVNSTKQPIGGTQISVVLKENCSLENPVFIVSTPITDYTYVEAFDHYYFVSDIVNINATQSEIHCGMDPMATYKAEIGATSAFVLYDETTNTTLNDNRLERVSTTSSARNKTQLHSAMSKVGTIIATVTGEQSTNSYVIGVADIDKLIPNLKVQIESIFAQDHVPTFDINDDFVPTVISAIKQIISSSSLAGNIRDVRWIPFNIAGVGSHTVKIGMYSTSITNAGLLSLNGTYRIGTEGKNLDIPWLYSDWRNCYNTDIYLHIPFVGDVSFPANQLIGETGIMINTAVDFVTGDMAIMIKGSTTGVYLGSYGASTGVILPIGNSSPSLGKMFTSLMQGLSSATSGGSIAGRITGAVQAGGQMALTAFTPFTQTVGGLGSGASIGLPFDVEITCIGHNTNVTPSSVASVMGTPTMAVKTLGNLSGYIQCSGASVSGSMHAGDREAINGMLNGGFFYE